VPPVNGASVRIERTVPVTQDSLWTPYSAFKAKTLEGQLDYRGMVDQQLDRDRVDHVGRIGALETGLDAEEVARAAGDAEAQGFASSLVSGVLAGTGAVPQVWAASGDGVTTRFSIAGAEFGAEAMYLVTISGLAKVPGEYSIDLVTDEIIFATAPANAALISVRSTGYSLGANEADTSLVTATGSTTARSLAARFSDVVNVKDYLPAGQPDGTTDNLAGINAARDAAKAAGKELVFGEGAFGVSAPIVFDNSVRGLAVRGSSDRVPYMGTGLGTRIVPLAGFPSGRGVLEFSSTPTESNDRPGAITVEGITIAGSASTSYGILIKSGRNVRFSRMHVTASLPLYVYPTGTFVDFIRFTDCFLQETGGGGEAVKLAHNTDDDLAVTDVIFDNVWFLGGKTAGDTVRIENVEGVEFRKPYFDPGALSIIALHVTSANALRAPRPITLSTVLAENVGTFLKVSGPSAAKVSIHGIRTLGTPEAAHAATGQAKYVIEGEGAHRVYVSNATHSAVEVGGDPLASVALTTHRFECDLMRGRVAPTYGATVAINTNLANQFDIDVSNASPFTISLPTLSIPGHEITIRVINNTAGAIGTITWGGYKMPTWTNPAASTSRSISFRYDGFYWVETSRTPADVPN
jgi:hypothetical protein